MFKGYAAMEAKGSLEPFEYEPAPLGPNDVEIEISHCGICHSDLHLIDNDWGNDDYPLVPGHEVVGTITEVGDAVAHLAAGVRVGVGWQRSSCLTCEWCGRGDENLCDQQQATCVGHHGGFADRIRIDSRFAFAIPDALASEDVAPLFCGGVTVYSPIRRFAPKAGSVGVIGIGGLGHMALRFANAFGCEVTAFSSTEDKKAEAESFGAHRFVASKDKAALKAERGRHDLIVSTVFAPLEWHRYLQALRPNGVLCFVGAPAKPLEIPAFMLLSGQKSVAGSIIGGRASIREMLEFAALHQISAQTEVLPFTELNTAIERLREGDVRYRFVLAR